jgi:hypothetical protein
MVARPQDAVTKDQTPRVQLALLPPPLVLVAHPAADTRDCPFRRVDDVRTGRTGRTLDRPLGWPLGRRFVGGLFHFSLVYFPFVQQPIPKLEPPGCQPRELPPKLVPVTEPVIVHDDVVGTRKNKKSRPFGRLFGRPGRLGRLSRLLGRLGRLLDRLCAIVRHCSLVMMI